MTMQHITNLTDLGTSKEKAHCNETSSAIPEKWMVAFMVRMEGIYREKWTAKWVIAGNDALTESRYQELKGDYAAYLSKMKPAQIAAAFKECDNNPKYEWPPSPRDFRLIGYENAKKRTLHKEFKALSKPNPDKEKGREAWKNMKAALHPAWEDMNNYPDNWEQT